MIDIEKFWNISSNIDINLELHNQDSSINFYLKTKKTPYTDACCIKGFGCNINEDNEYDTWFSFKYNDYDNINKFISDIYEQFKE